MTTSTTPLFDPRQLQHFDVLVNGSTNGVTDDVMKATKTGAGYALVPYDFQIDHVELMYALSSNASAVNTAGSGNFEVIAYEDGVALWVANTLQIAYASAVNYASVTAADLAVVQLTKGREIRVDITEVFAGAATSYPAAPAVVRIVGIAR